MRKSTKLAIAFVALAGAVGSAAYADQSSGMQHRGDMMRLRQTMKQNGSISFDQFSDAMDSRLKKMVADNGGKLTVEQLAQALEKARYERMAKRIIDRYATKDDGTLTSDDISGREKKIFALLDKNDDGKIEKSELPHGQMGHRWGGHRWSGHKQSGDDRG